MKLYYWFLFIAFFSTWVWAAINPVHPDDWLLENYLVFLFVPLILITARYFRLSAVSYTLITVFMILHVIGSHYTYAEVPFGFRLQEWLGSGRNMYDRLVHFSFGLLIAYPMREMFLRVAKSKGFWGFFFPVDITLSVSAVYELIEWFAAVNVDASAGIAFLGAQGDVWDAQKDMGLAGAGALIAMLIVFLLNWKFNKQLGSEMKESFALEQGDQPLGEAALRRWFRS